MTYPDLLDDARLLGARPGEVSVTLAPPTVGPATLAAHLASGGLLVVVAPADGASELRALREAGLDLISYEEFDGPDGGGARVHARRVRAVFRRPPADPATSARTMDG